MQEPRAADDNGAQHEIVFDYSQAQAKNPRMFNPTVVKHISELDFNDKKVVASVDGEHFLV